MTRIISLCLSLFLAGSCLAEQQTWYFIRHFEKQQGADPHLTEAGQQRAQALIAMLNDKPLSKIYSTKYNRTQQSVAPLATDRSFDVIIYDPSNLEDFAKQINAENNVIIVGHSNTTPQLIRLMGAEIADLSEQDYGQLFTLIKRDNQTELSIQSIGAK